MLFKWYKPDSVDNILEVFHSVIEDLENLKDKLKNKMSYHEQLVDFHTQAKAEAINEHDRAHAASEKIQTLVN